MKFYKIMLKRGRERTLNGVTRHEWLGISGGGAHATKYAKAAAIIAENLLSHPKVRTYTDKYDFELIPVENVDDTKPRVYSEWCQLDYNRDI